MLRTLGYLVSIFGVTLLGAALWREAAKDPLLLELVALGVAASIAGILLRWLASRAEARARRRGPATILQLVDRRRAPGS